MCHGPVDQLLERVGAGVRTIGIAHGPVAEHAQADAGAPGLRELFHATLIDLDAAAKGTLAVDLCSCDVAAGSHLEQPLHGLLQ